jgi:hypothetical protein
MKTSMAVLSCILLFSGCGLFDSGVEWKSGRYGLVWVDLPEEVTLAYDMGNGSWATLVEPRVFAIGSNEHYVVAKQHPQGDKKMTRFFIIDILVDSQKPGRVIGPLNEKAFQEKVATLALPAFTRTLESLQ